LGDRGDIDTSRVQISGGSAGGYTTLLAMAVRDEFAVGVSFYGVADLVTFHADTHKFESHYDDYLVGPWPGAIEGYRERAPGNPAAAHARVPGRGTRRGPHRRGLHDADRRSVRAKRRTADSVRRGDRRERARLPGAGLSDHRPRQDRGSVQRRVAVEADVCR